MNTAQAVQTIRADIARLQRETKALMRSTSVSGTGIDLAEVHALIGFGQEIRGHLRALDRTAQLNDIDQQRGRSRFSSKQRTYARHLAHVHERIEHDELVVDRDLAAVLHTLSGLISLITRAETSRRDAAELREAIAHGTMHLLRELNRVDSVLEHLQRRLG